MEQVYKFGENPFSFADRSGDEFEPMDSIKMAESALLQAERRMANLRRLAADFGLDNPGPPDPRVA